MPPSVLVLVAIAVGSSAWFAIRIFKNRGPAGFASKVSGALFDLGIQVLRLEDQLKTNLSRECLAYHGALGTKANPRLFATRFFLRATIEFPAFSTRALMFDGVMVRSIGVVREWKKKGRVPDSTADEFVLEIKKFLLEGIKQQKLSEVDKLAIEIQVLEL